MNKSIVSGLLLLFITVSVPILLSAKWKPKEDVVLYKKAMKQVKEIEPFSKFLYNEHNLLKGIDNNYYKERWAYIKAVSVDNPKVQTPRRPMVKFIAYCKTLDISDEDLYKFETSVLALGNELITDKVGFEVKANNIIAHRDIPYVTNDGYSQTLDLFLPKGIHNKPIPCVIFIHGGGWQVHKKAWMEGFAKYFAQKGYAAATIDYRLVPVVSPVECIQDAKAAVRWVRKNAKKYGINPNKIGASGGSAGANLSVLLATSHGVENLEGTVGNNNVSSEIQAAVGFATPTLTGNRKTWPWKKGAKPTWYETVSPYNYISADDAPVIFIHGSDDKTVAVEEAKEMYEKYKEIGIKTHLEILKGERHVFFMNEEIADKAFYYFKSIFE